MNPKSKDAYLGILTAFGILYIIKLLAGSMVTQYAILSETIVSHSLTNLIIFQLIPFALISVLVSKKLSISKLFTQYFIAAAIIGFIGEIVLLYWP